LTKIEFVLFKGNMTLFHIFRLKRSVEKFGVGNISMFLKEDCQAEAQKG